MIKMKRLAKQKVLSTLSFATEEHFLLDSDDIGGDDDDRCNDTHVAFAKPQEMFKDLTTHHYCPTRIKKYTYNNFGGVSRWNGKSCKGPQSKKKWKLWIPSGTPVVVGNTHCDSNKI